MSRVPIIVLFVSCSHGWNILTQGTAWQPFFLKHLCIKKYSLDLWSTYLCQKSCLPLQNNGVGVVHCDTHSVPQENEIGKGVCPGREEDSDVGVVVVNWMGFPVNAGVTLECSCLPELAQLHSWAWTAPSAADGVGNWESLYLEQVSHEED